MSKLFTALGELSNSNAAHQRSNVLLLGWPAQCCDIFHIKNILCKKHSIDYNSTPGVLQFIYFLN
jgi:hypothetical protein